MRVRGPMRGGCRPKSPDDRRWPTFHEADISNSLVGDRGGDDGIDRCDRSHARSILPVHPTLPQFLVIVIQFAQYHHSVLV